MQPVKRKNRRAIRNIDDDLKHKLIAVYKERPKFSIVGIRFLCSDSTINNLCKEAESVEDALLLKVRPELSINDTSSCIHKSCRRRLE